MTNEQENEMTKENEFVPEIVWQLRPDDETEPSREQCYIYRVPGTEKRFHVWHLQEDGQVNAFLLGYFTIEAYCYGPGDMEVKRSELGREVSDPLALASHVAWYPLQQGSFELTDFRRFVGNRAVKQLVEDTKAKPRIIQRLPGKWSDYYHLAA